jgi:hypothetical protein
MWFVLSLRGRGTSSVELQGKYWLRVFEDRGRGVGYFGVRRGEEQEFSDNYIIRSFMLCTFEQIMLG